MMQYQGGSMNTGLPPELTTEVNLDEAFDFQIEPPLVAESSANNAGFGLDFLAQTPPGQPSEHSGDGSATKRYKCTRCPDKSFTAQYMLTKHEKYHTKPLQCHLCPVTKAERKDLNRHFWVDHKAYAQENGIPTEIVTCPECGQETRSDNLKRHKERMHSD